MPTDHKSLVYRWFDEVWDQGREETIDELFGQDAVALGLGLGDAPVYGPAGFKIFWRNMREALPDVQINVEDTIVEGDKIAVRVVLEGTHRGQGLGVAPTGRRVKIAGIVLVQFAEGKITKGWNSWDQLGLLQQLGAIPSAGDRFLAASR
jgi:steroid delta-isomerase-like uncharacterized protein